MGGTTGRHSGLLYPGGPRSADVAMGAVLVALAVFGWGAAYYHSRPPRTPPVPPTSPVRYTTDDARRIAQATILKREPSFTRGRIAVGPLTTEYPGVEKGRPIYPCLAKGRVSDGRRMLGYLTPLVIDATTGKVFEPGPFPLPGEQQRGRPGR